MTKIMYGHLEIGNVSDSSRLTVGNNVIADFINVRKINQGFGSINGFANNIADNIAWLTDEDEVDAWRNPEWRTKGEKTTRSTC